MSRDRKSNAFQRIKEYLPKMMYAILSVILGCVLLLNLFSWNVDYSNKNGFLLPNIVLLLIATLIGLSASVLVCRKYKGKSVETKNTFLFINIFSVLLFFILLFIAYNIGFYTGWDAELVICDARRLAKGEGIDWTYYSWYPNQQCFLFVEALVFKINNLFGIVNTEVNEGATFIISALQCLLYSITGNILYRAIYNFTSKKFYAWTGWGIYCFLLAISGWIVIPYTDGLAVVFPILILFCYQNKEKCDNNTKKIVWWTAISLLSFWGFKLRPQVLIIFIAIVIGEILHGIGEINKQKLLDFVKVLAVILICVVVSAGVFKIATKATGVNKELSFGAMHMVMMGLNDETDGVYYQEDVDLSSGITDKDARQEAQLATIEQRLDNYGVDGLLKHEAKKALVDFNDGTFAWGMEGSFYKEVYDEKNGFISPLLRDIFYNTGDLYKYTETVEQALWLFTLLLCALCFLLKKDKFLTAAVTSLIGIISFNLIFEARARYVIIYVPIFVVLAVISLRNVSETIAIRIASRMDKDRE